MDEVNNYHPVTLFPPACKLLEEVISNSWCHFLINTIYLAICNLDSENLNKKRCSSLNHNQYITENLNGIYGISHNHIKSYLKYRTQQAQILHKEDKHLKVYLCNSSLPVMYGVFHDYVLRCSTFHHLCQ